MNFLNEYEIGILDFIAEHLKCDFLDFLMPIITLFGDAGIFWIAVAVVMLCFKSTRKSGLVMGGALLMGLLVGNMFLKPVIGRIRPYDVKEGVELLVEKLHDYSFPSGHTLASFEAAGALLICERKRFGYLALVLAILIAFSRMYLYVHYPTDILAGIVLGLLFAFLSYKLVTLAWNKYAPRVSEYFANKKAKKN